jgi:exonuclease III
MKKIVILFLFVSCGLYSQVKLLSWNIENLGSSKSESEIAFMAKTVKDYDILTIQEVVVGDGGVKAVAKLAAA